MPHSYQSLGLDKLVGPDPKPSRLLEYKGVPIEKLDWSNISWGLRESIKLLAQHRFGIFLPDGKYIPVDTRAEVEHVLSSLPENTPQPLVFMTGGGVTIQFD